MTCARGEYATAFVWERAQACTKKKKKKKKKNKKKKKKKHKKKTKKKKKKKTAHAKRTPKMRPAPVFTSPRPGGGLVGGRSGGLRADIASVGGTLDSMRTSTRAPLTAATAAYATPYAAGYANAGASAVRVRAQGMRHRRVVSLFSPP